MSDLVSSIVRSILNSAAVRTDEFGRPIYSSPELMALPSIIPSGTPYSDEDDIPSPALVNGKRTAVQRATVPPSNTGLAQNLRASNMIEDERPTNERKSNTIMRRDLLQAALDRAVSPNLEDKLQE